MREAATGPEQRPGKSNAAVVEEPYRIERNQCSDNNLALGLRQGAARAMMRRYLRGLRVFLVAGHAPAACFPPRRGPSRLGQ